MVAEGAVRLVPNAGNFHNQARSDLKKQGALSHPVKLEADTKGFNTRARERLKMLPPLKLNVNLRADVTGFHRDAQTKIDLGRDLKVRVKMRFDRSGLQEEINYIQTRLDMRRFTVRVEVRLDTAMFRAQLAAITRRRSLRIDIDSPDLLGLQAQLLLLQGNLRMTGSAARSAGRGFLMMGASAYALLIALVALAAVSLIPLIGQLWQAAGVLALLPAMAGAAAAAVGALGIGMTGIMTAFQAMKKKNNASTSTANLINDQKRLTQAEKQLRKAQDDAARSQQKLNNERRLAVRRLRDMNDELDMAPINEEAARIAVERARQGIAEAYADGSDPLDIREAKNNYDQAVESLDQLVKKNQDLKTDVTAANRAGIEGDQGVVDANEQVAASIEGIGDAVDNVADAQENLNTKMGEGTKEADAFAEAMANLSPNAQAFVLAIQSLSGAWKDLRFAVQDALLGNELGDQVVQLAEVYLPILKEGFVGIATEINGGIGRFFDRLETENAQGNFAKIFENARLAMAPLLDGITSMMEGLGNIAGVGSEFLPGIAETFKNTMDEFAKWSGSEEGQNEIRAYIDESIKTIDSVWEFVKALGRVLQGLFNTSDEVGESMLEGMTRSLNEFADWMDTADGEKQMGTWWETIKQTITDIMSMIGQAIVLADKLLKIAAALGLLDDDEPPPGATSEENSTLNKGGKTFKDRHGRDVDKDGNVLIGKGGFFPGAREGSPMGWLLDLFGGDDGSGGYRDPKDRENLNNSVNSGPKFLPGPNDTIDVPNPYGKGGMRKPMTKTEWMSYYTPGTEAAAEAEKIFDETWQRENANTNESLGEQKGFFGSFGDKIGKVFGGIVEGDMPSFMGGLGDTFGSIFGFRQDSDGELNGWETNTTGIFGRIVGTVFPSFGPGIDKVVQFGRDAVGQFANIWQGLKEAAAEPINWIIRNVINGTLKGAWDGLRKILPALPEWDGVGEIEVKNDGSGKAEGGMTPTPKFWKGGVLPGYTPGRDPFTIGVSGGEAVMRPEWTRAMGPDYVDEMNGVARREGVLGVKKRMGYFSNGGIVDAMQSIMAEKFPMLELTSGLRYTDNGLHSKGMAADFSNGGIEGTPEMKQASQWWYENFQPDLLQLIHMPFNNNVLNGQNVGDGMAAYTEGTMLEHRHHLHVGTDKVLGADGTSSPAEPGFLDRVKNAVGGAVQSGRNRLAGVANGLVNGPFDLLKKSLPDFGGSGFGQIPGAMVDSVRNAVLSKIQGFIGGGGSSADAGNTPWDLGAGVEQWRGQVIEALRREGFDDGIRNQNLMLAQIMSESSGDPNAIQQVQDVNSGGNEAVGLLQVIPGTFAANRNPALPNDRTNPDASMSAALRYYRATYGEDLGAMWGQGHGYDQGGIANGIGIMPKYTLEPERVLSPAQTAAFEQLIPFLGRLFGVGQQQGPVDVNIAQLDGSKLPTTANTDGRNVIEGEMYGQDLQGAAIDAETGEYLPENNTKPVDNITITKPALAFSKTTEGKIATSIANSLGFGGQAQWLTSKEEPVMKLMSAISGATVAQAAGPEAFAAHLASTQLAAGTQITKNLGDYAAENAGGMIESLLSAVGGGLAGGPQISTTASPKQIMGVMEDAQNRANRRGGYRRTR